MFIYAPSWQQSLKIKKKLKIALTDGLTAAVTKLELQLPVQKHCYFRSLFTVAEAISESAFLMLPSLFYWFSRMFIPSSDMLLAFGAVG